MMARIQLWNVLRFLESRAGLEPHPSPTPRFLELQQAGVKHEAFRLDVAIENVADDGRAQPYARRGRGVGHAAGAAGWGGFAGGPPRVAGEGRVNAELVSAARKWLELHAGAVDLAREDAEAGV